MKTTWENASGRKAREKAAYFLKARPLAEGGRTHDPRAAAWRHQNRRLRFFAPGLIADKPVKPCDGGVFGALNLLLISEHGSGKAGWISFSKSTAQSQPKASASLDRLLADRHSIWFTQRTGLCFAQIAARLLQAAFSEPVQRGGREPFFAAVRTPETAFISLLV